MEERPQALDDPFADPELRARAIGSLRTIVHVLVALISLMAILQVMRGDPLAAIVPVALIAGLSPLLLLLLRAGKVNEAALGLCLLILLGSAANLAGFGSVRGAGVAGVFGSIALAGAFLGTRTLVVFLVLASLLLGAVTWAGNAGLIGPADLSTGPGHWLTITVALAAFGVCVRAIRLLMVDTVRNLRREFAQRKGAEAALLEREMLLASALRSTPVGVAVSTLDDGRLRAVNAAYERLFGRTREELIGATHHELGLWVHYDDRLRFLEVLKRDGKVERYPARFRGPEGEFDALITSEVMNLDGRACSVSSFTDLRDTLMALERLKRSEERFARTFEMSPIALSITRCSDGLVIETNAAMQALAGKRIAKDEIATARSLRLWVDPTERDRLIALVRAQGSVAAFEARMRTNAGVEFDARIWATIIELDGEDCLAVALANTTQEKKDEALILSIARGMSEGIGDTLFRDLVMNVREAVGADVVMVGEVSADAVSSIALLVDGEIGAPQRYPLEGTPCGATAGLESGGLLVVRDGVEESYPAFPEALRTGMRAYVGASLRDEDGRPIGVLSMLSRKPFEHMEKIEALFRIFASRARGELLHRIDQRRILELNESLEARVRLRTRELEDAVTELESFSYSVSHDLMAPLRSINGFASIVLQEAGERLDEDHRSMLRRCVGQADRMGALVNDLLNLARVGRRPLEMRPVDITQLAQEVGAEILATEPGRAIAIEVQPGMVDTCDRGLIRVVLENLVRNAVKFTQGREEARVTIGYDGGSYFVRDNGVGFDSAHAPTLFKPFHRLHTEAEFPGTGIGLAIVARVVGRHGGQVRADGEPGVGATIHFSLGKPVPRPSGRNPVL